MRDTIGIYLPWNISFALCAVGALVACGENKHRQPSTDSKVQIVGGRPVGSDVDDARRLSTVALTTDRSSSRRSGSLPLLAQGQSFCTATIIAERALLTAAHCIQEFDPQTNIKSRSYILPAKSDFIAFFGTRVSIDGEWLRAAEVIPHPDWSPALTLQGDSSLPPHDIGIVILEKNVPAPYRPVAIADESAEIHEDHPVTLVGYGVTRSRLKNNTGTLREVNLPLKNIDKQSQLLGVGSFMKGACAGDSGGPMYAQDDSGKWFVIGVTSAGIEILQNCVGLDNSYTDARAHKKWVEKTLREHGLQIEN